MAEGSPETPPDEVPVPSAADAEALQVPAGQPAFSADLNRLEPQFAHQQVNPPNYAYLDRSVRFWARVETSLQTVTVDVSAFILRNNGVTEEFRFSVTGRSDTDVIEDIAEPLGGYLLSVSATTETPSVYYGTTFVTVGLARGGISSFIVPRVLIANYVSQLQYISWPELPLINSVEGPGYARVIVGSTPAAGQNFSETVPTNRRWRLRSLTVVMTTDATVANRELLVGAKRGSDRLWIVGPGIFQTASDTRRYSMGQNLPPNIGAGRIYNIPMPDDTILIGGDVLHSINFGFQAADTLTALVYTVQEWLERA